MRAVTLRRLPVASGLRQMSGEPILSAVNASLQSVWNLTVAPMTPEVANFLGLAESSDARMLRAMGAVQEEVYLGDIRPDLLVVSKRPAIPS